MTALLSLLANDAVSHSRRCTLLGWRRLGNLLLHSSTAARAFVSEPVKATNACMLYICELSSLSPWTPAMFIWTTEQRTNDFLSRTTEHQISATRWVCARGTGALTVLALLGAPYWNGRWNLDDIALCTRTKSLIASKKCDRHFMANSCDVKWLRPALAKGPIWTRSCVCACCLLNLRELTREAIAALLNKTTLDRREHYSHFLCRRYLDRILTSGRVRIQVAEIKQEASKFWKLLVDRWRKTVTFLLSLHGLYTWNFLKCWFWNSFVFGYFTTLSQLLTLCSIKW